MKVMTIGNGSVIECDSVDQAILAQDILAQWGFRVVRRENTIISSNLSPDDIASIIGWYHESLILG